MASNRASTAFVVRAVAGVLLFAAAGCVSLENSFLSDFGYFAPSDGGPKAEAAHRDRYQSHKDREAMRWLLAHRIHSGMSVNEVERTFGEEGERIYDDHWIKRGEGHYLDGDVVYRWGPDNRGTSAYLAFRDGHLVNFEPKEFAE